MARSAVKGMQPAEQFFQFSLLGLVVSGYLALASSGTLDLPTMVFTALGLLLRLLLITGTVRFQVSGRILAAVTLAYIGFYPIDVLYVSREFIPATVHLICFLAVIRILTASSSRDYFFVKLIAFLELVAATLLSVSVQFFVFLTLFLICGVATFCSSEIRRSSQASKQILIGGPLLFARRLSGLTAAVTLGIVIMTGGLFFLLPRTARAAFRSIVSERYHLPGFSNEVMLGQIGELKQQSTPVMHARIEEPNEKLSLKWRGATLSRFDGKRWWNPPGRMEKIQLAPGLKATQLVDDSVRGRLRKRINYEVRTGAMDTDTLFFAGTPELLNIDNLTFVYRGSGDTYRTGNFTSDGRHYRVYGQRSDAPGEPDPSAADLELHSRIENTLLPDTLDGRIPELARSTGVGATPLARARAIEKYLRTSFGYTTELPQERHRDPLAYFLFERKRGHCEYFASAMAVMLRSIQIPARVVTGFQSGTFNPMTGWHVIRASDAHSWVEAWIPQLGWMTFDPTPPDLSRGTETNVWAKVLLYLDTADTWWRDWVVNYSLDQQVDLVAGMERHTRLFSSGMKLNESVGVWAEAMTATIRPWAMYIGIAVVSILGIWLAGPRIYENLIARRHSARVSNGNALPSDAALLYGRMLRILKRRGLEKPAWLTPMEFARIVPLSHDAALVEQITLAYQDLRYGGRTEAGPKMVRLLEQLETAPGPYTEADKASSRSL